MMFRRFICFNFLLLFLLGINISFSQTFDQLGDPINGKENDEFLGKSVAINKAGNIIVVGAPYNTNYGSFSTLKTGKARVYQYVGGSWVQKGADLEGEPGGRYPYCNGSPTHPFAKQNNGTCQADYNFGNDVAISDDGLTVAVASEYGSDLLDSDYSNNNYPPSASGYVKVYKFDGTNYVLKGEKIHMRTDAQYGYVSRFAHSIDLNHDGTFLTVGSENPSTNGGRVFNYSYYNNKWNRIGDVNELGSYSYNGGASNYAVGWSFSTFGADVSQNKDGSVFVTSEHFGPRGGDNQGAVVTFYYNGTWEQLNGSNNTILGEGKFGNGDLNAAGYSLALNDRGDVLVIGQPGNDGFPPVEDRGSVRVYTRNCGSCGVSSTSTNWTQLGGDLDGINFQEKIGKSVTVARDFNMDDGFQDGIIAVAGGLTSTSFTANSVARVYKWTGSAWDQVGSDILKTITQNYLLILVLTGKF